VKKKEYKLKMFENRVLWRIFGGKKEDVTGERRKLGLHSEEFHDLFSPQNAIG
jgi:hypothetical protein